MHYTHTLFPTHVLVFLVGSDVFSTSTDGCVLWWDIRKLGEPVETLPLEFAGYRSGQKLGGIALEYESTMVSFSLLREYHSAMDSLYHSANKVYGGN